MFDIPTFEQIRTAILRDTQSLDPSADISPDSDHFVHASRLAACATGQYAHQTWIVRQIFPDTADTAYLERHAALRGLLRRKSTFASGTAYISGVAGATVAVGLTLKQGKRFYRTTHSASIGSNGLGTVAIVAAEAGVSHNAPQAPAQFMAAPAGISGDCLLEAQGGTEAESDASLLARLLEHIRRPPAGGNQYDYKNWALSVDGVTDAYVYPLRRGLGTVDIAIVSEQGLPSDDIVRQAQDYIDQMRPVTAKNAKVFAPDVSLIEVRVAVKLHGVDLPTAQDRIEAALNAYFATLAPTDDLLVSQIEAAISNVEGVVDRQLHSPSANRQADVVSKIEWFRLGAVRVEVMP